MVLSAVLAGANWAVTNPATGKQASVRNALSVTGIRDLISGAEEAGA